MGCNKKKGEWGKKLMTRICYLWSKFEVQQIRPKTKRIYNSRGKERASKYQIFFKDDLFLVSGAALSNTV